MGLPNPIQTSRGLEGRGWYVYCYDADIDTGGPHLITELATTYAQIAAADTVEIVSSEAADTTQTVTVTGVDSNDKLAVDDIDLNGTTIVGGTVTFKYVDQIVLDTVATGTVTVQRATGNTFINSIAPGYLIGGVACHYNGDKYSYITDWGVSNVGGGNTIAFQLEMLDQAETYLIPLDRMSVPASVSSDYRSLPDIRVPKNCKIQVTGVGGADNQAGSVWIAGYDSLR